MHDGYDKNFLGDGKVILLPTFNAEIEGDVLKNDELHDGYIADYLHYSLVMSKSSRQALFSAANVDQSSIQTVSGRKWFIDPRIGHSNQIGPEAYYDNPWDRGHLTRRTAITWGSTTRIAKRASNDSCSYANASMQHANFNQDEWRVPEEVVRTFDRDKNNKLCVFTGPVYTQADRWYTRRTLSQAVRIPGGFWKIIAYIGKESNELECQAYVMYQDTEFISDKKGRKTIEEGNYQVTVTEIERLTGLEFADELYDANPLFFTPRPGINEGPEGFRTPLSTNTDELKTKGIIFSREDIEKKDLKKRRREVSEEDFIERTSFMDIS